MASIDAVQREIRNNLVNNNRFGILKFVDIGEGNGRLGEGGVLQAEKLDKFIQAMTESTTFLDNIKMKLSDNDNAEVDSMSFEVELEAGRVNGIPQTLSNMQTPNFLNRRFSAEELRALTGIHRTALRQNIEKKGFMNTLTQSFGSACGKGLERILIYGNKKSTASDVASGYKVVDGAIATIQNDGDNSVEEIDLTATDSNIVKELRRLVDEMPDKYSKSSDTKMLVPECVLRSARRFIADNKQGDASITYIQERGTFAFESIPLISVPAFSDLRNGFTKKPVILTHGENLQFLINTEKVIVEDAFNIRTNTWDIASTVYSDINFVHPDAISLAFVKEA